MVSRWNRSLVITDCERLGWHDAELARRAGLPRQTVSLFMHGQRGTARTMKAIADALGKAVSRYRLK